MAFSKLTKILATGALVGASVLGCNSPEKTNYQPNFEEKMQSYFERIDQVEQKRDAYVQERDEFNRKDDKDFEEAVREKRQEGIDVYKVKIEQIKKEIEQYENTIEYLRENKGNLKIQKQEIEDKYNLQSK